MSLEANWFRPSALLRLALIINGLGVGAMFGKNAATVASAVSTMRLKDSKHPSGNLA